jgi:DNA repair protein RadA
LAGKDVVGKAQLSGRDLLNYRTKKIQFLETGASNLDEALGGGYETGVITELYGDDGSGKTQLCMLACIKAQLSYRRKCFKCSQTFDDQSVERCPDCEVKTESFGGLSEEGKPCRVIYMDTENSFRPERVLEMVLERGLVQTKEQTPAEIKKGVKREALNDEETEKALKFLDNITVLKPSGAGHQIMIAEEMGSIIEGKEDEDRAKLLVVDSLMSNLRLEYAGRANLSDRQVALSPHIKHLSRTAEIYNIIVLITNQVLKDPSAGSYTDPTKAIGGMALAHTSTHRIYLKKVGSKGKIVAILVDSPNNAKTEGILMLTKKGIENAEK